MVRLSEDSIVESKIVNGGNWKQKSKVLIPEPYITYFLRQSDTSLITGYRSDRRDNARSFKLAQLIDKLVM